MWHRIFKFGFVKTYQVSALYKRKIVKDVTKIKEVTQDIMSSYGLNPKSQFLRTSSMDNINDPQRNVKERFSVDDSVDSDGNELSAEQQEYFRDSKLDAANTFDVDPEIFVGYYEIRERFDEDGNGHYSNYEVKAAIDSMTGYNLTADQKAVLWQLMTGSKSAKNNPYSTSEGQRVLDYLSDE